MRASQQWGGHIATSRFRGAQASLHPQERKGGGRVFGCDGETRKGNYLGKS